MPALTTNRRNFPSLETQIGSMNQKSKSLTPGPERRFKIMPHTKIVGGASRCPLTGMEAKGWMSETIVSYILAVCLTLSGFTGTHLLLLVELELRCRELSSAGGTKGRTTPETRQDIAIARAARLSGRGRCAEKCRIERRGNCVVTMTDILVSKCRT